MGLTTKNHLQMANCTGQQAVYLPVTQHSAPKTITQNTAAPWHNILITFNIFSLHSYRQSSNENKSLTGMGSKQQEFAVIG